MYKCSFTGHRQIKSEHRKALPDLIMRAVEYAYSEGCRTFYSGGAIGFDTLAARAVIKFRISHPDVRLVLLLPCVDQDKKWSEAQRSAYAHIISNSDEIVYISEEYREGCIKERNFLLATEADILIAYVSRFGSGAAQTVRMAQARDKRVYNLYPTLEKEENK